MDDMGSFRIDLEIENNSAPGARREMRGVLVDTGVERRVVRRFRQADGSVLERWTGQVSIYAAGAWTVDQVIFGEPGDLVLLGSRSLEGLNLRVDPVAKRLSDAGPMPLAAAA